MMDIATIALFSIPIFVACLLVYASYIAKRPCNQFGGEVHDWEVIGDFAHCRNCDIKAKKVTVWKRSHGEHKVKP